MQPLKINEINFKNIAFLAPMAGYTDLAFRTLASKYNVGMITTEMVNAKALTRHDDKTFRLMQLPKTDVVKAVQIFGSDPISMRESVENAINNINEVDIIDINMGCPAPKVVKNGDGSALMKNPELAIKIAGEVVKVSKKPVTCKIRMGWDEKNINAVELSKGLESVGISAITIHGRTREMFYSGNADWDIIKSLKENLSIPIIGNGDIFSVEDALKILNYTKCDAIQIGRGAIGNPWIFSNILKAINEEGYDNPSNEEIYQTIIEHYNLMIEDKGERIAINEMRKHLPYYIKGQKSSGTIRRKLNELNNVDEILDILKKYLLKGEN